jgi:2'-5' RNA ligase
MIQIYKFEEVSQSMTIYTKQTDPNVFGFGILIPEKYYSYIQRYRKELLPYVDWFVKRRKYTNNEMGPHITIKYLSYHKDYSNQEIKKRIPELREICKRYLPFEIKVNGIGVKKINNRISIFLKFKPKLKLKEFHNEVLRLKGIDLFLDIDAENYDPHIAIATAEWNKENWKRIGQIIKKHKKDKSIRVLCNDAYIFFKKKGTVIIYSSVI